MNTANALVFQAIARHKSDLSGWARRVTAHRSLAEALLDASHRPPLPAMARGLAQMARPEAARAEARIEHHLLDLAGRIEAGDPALPRLMRLAQGHWPRVWQVLDRTRRSPPGGTA